MFNHREPIMEQGIVGAPDVGGKRKLQKISKLPVTGSGYADDAGLVDDAERLLRRAGYKVLGTGAYSVVLAHRSPNKVVKVSLSEQDPYREYVSYVLWQQRLARRKKKGAPSQSFARMLPRIYSHGEVNGVHITVLERLQDYGNGTGIAYENAKQRLRADCPYGARLDLHSANRMFRDNGEVVITDPWAHSESDSCGFDTSSADHFSS